MTTFLWSISRGVGQVWESRESDVSCCGASARAVGVVGTRGWVGPQVQGRIGGSVGSLRAWESNGSPMAQSKVVGDRG